MLTAVTGINWGDEGKGRVIDLLAENADVVVRYQGGNNAGHTVVAKQQKVVLNLLPSGILHENVVCVLGDGMVVDLEHLTNEIAQIREKGVVVTPKNLKLSKRATISMPWHKIQDELEETRLAKTGSAFGSTKRGIAYAYSDKYRKKTLRLGDLLHLKEESVQNRLKMMLEAKNLELAGCYHQEPMSYPALLSWCEDQAAELWPYIVDTGAYLEEALKEGKRVVLEAQLGAMRDIDYGIFPIYIKFFHNFCLRSNRGRDTGKAAGPCRWCAESLFNLCRCRAIYRRKSHAGILDGTFAQVWWRIWCCHRTSTSCRSV